MKQSGFAPILVIFLVVIAIGSTILTLVMKNTAHDNPNLTTKPAESTVSAMLDHQPSPIPSETPKPTLVKPVVMPSLPAPSPTPLQAKTITVSGFAYEDRNNDGLFNSDDPKIPYMQFKIYDSATNEWIDTIYSGQDGSFTATITVKGTLILKPTCNDNFCPRGGQKEYSSSSSNEQFGFRSASAPTGNNNGIVEGDVIIENNRLYKFYLLDKDGNYYTGNSAGGHFTYQNLPNDKTYIIRISYSDGSTQDTEVTLTPSSPKQQTIQIRIK